MKSKAQILDEYETIREHCSLFNGYYYLASPYTSQYSSRRTERYLTALKAMNVLMLKGIVVFGPVAHTHPLATKFRLPKDSEYWMKYDKAFVKNSIGMIMLLIDGWMDSNGMKTELEMVRTRQSYPLYIMTEMTIDNEDVFDLKRMEKNIYVNEP